MIIHCKNCNKKFKISDTLIPIQGRLVQCGSCDSKWHQKKNEENILKIDPTLIINEEENNNDKEESNEHLKPKNKKSEEDILLETKKNLDNALKMARISKEMNIDEKDIEIINKKQKIGFLSTIFILIISTVALVLIVDTFQYQLGSLFPNLENYLEYLYENLLNIFILGKDLFKSY